MKGQEFSQALGEIDSRYIEEGIRYSAPRRAGRLPRRWLRRGAAAACLCILLAAGLLLETPISGVVTAPGLLTVTAFAADTEEPVVIQEGIELPGDYRWSLAMSSRPGLPLELSAPGYPDAEFEVSADGGALLLWEGNQVTHLQSPFCVEQDTTIYWTSMQPAADSQTGGDGFTLYTEDNAYLDIVIWEEGNIVGYAVVEIYRDKTEHEMVPTYCVRLLRSVSFPKVDGEYQGITAEYAASEIGAVKEQVRTLGTET